MPNEIQKIQTQLTENYIEDIRTILKKAREYTYRTINNIMVQAYWLIGERIVRQEQNGKERADYGKQIITTLSKELSKDFGTGFSAANLRNMRQFYRSFPDFEICYTLCSELSWSHNRLIMRVDDSKARMFYLKEAIENHWSTRQLERNIHSFYYQRTLSSQNLIVEPPETSHFYIDLVFYNYILKCFVLIDLKDTKLQHKDIGQMDMYVRMFDDLMRREGDNPTVGILLCAERDETIVKYSVANGSHQLFVSKYLPYMPTEEEIRRQIERKQDMK